MQRFSVPFMPATILISLYGKIVYTFIHANFLKNLCYFYLPLIDL